MCTSLQMCGVHSLRISVEVDGFNEDGICSYTRIMAEP